MKILFITHKWQAKTGESCVKALRSLGHDAHIAWAKIGATSLFEKIYYKVKRSHKIGPLLTGFEIVILNKLIVKKALSLKPDLIIVNAGGEVSPTTLEELRSKVGSKIVCWAGDDPNSYKLGPYYKAGVMLYDHYFLVDPSWYSGQFKKLGVNKCSILEYGVDPTVYKPLHLNEKARIKYRADLCHLGSLHNERKDILIQLADYDLALWGATTTRFFKSLSSVPAPLRPMVKSGVVPADISNKIYNCSKICLNIQHSQVRSAHSNKTYEIAASGSFLLTSYCDQNNRSFAKDELICFRNIRELRSLIDYYLKNEEERRLIAKKAYQRTVANHLYMHRMQQLLAEIRV